MTEIIEHPASSAHEDDDGEIKRHRVRVRKRIKIKKKGDPKKKFKKYLRVLIWLAVLVAFISTFVVLFRQSDVKEKNTGKKRSMINTAPAPANFC